MSLFKKIHIGLSKVKVTFQELLRRCRYKDALKESYHSFQGKYKNSEKCFIIGNGPSLRVEDLERISANGYVTFAANRIYKMFPETSWRPTYYGVCDSTLFKKSEEEIKSVESTKFIPLDIYDKLAHDKSQYHVFSRVPFSYFNLPPKFSNSIDHIFGEGGTITYHFMQLAVAMGFKEIYLIGMDFSFSFGIGADGKYFEDKTVKSNHFGADKSTIDVAPNIYFNLQAYRKAEQFTRSHGVRIYNATRGGKLEVFERKDFDSLFV